MQVIDLTKSKDPVRVFRNALEPNINPAGTWILYHQGDYADQVGTTALGRAVYDASANGEVHMVQKMISVDPREYAYYAVVR